jgi:hypothetical protein
MRISITITDGSDLEAKMKEFNKHERSAFIKMALTKWFCEGSPTITPIIIPKSSAPATSTHQDAEANSLKQVMGDFSD